MFESSDGKKMPCIVMIDQEKGTLEIFSEIFRLFFPEIKFFAIAYPIAGIRIAELYAADLVILEIHHSNYEFLEKDVFIKEVRCVCPEAKVLIYSVCNEADIVSRYVNMFCVDGYLTKPGTSLETVVRRACDILGEPCHI